MDERGVVHALKTFHVVRFKPYFLIEIHVSYSATLVVRLKLYFHLRTHSFVSETHVYKIATHVARLGQKHNSKTYVFQTEMVVLSCTIVFHLKNYTLKPTFSDWRW